MNKSGSSQRLPSQILAISQPATPNCRPLAGTVDEVEQIKSCVRDITWLNGVDATVKAVLEAMGTHSWCHFACHGIQRLENPTQSAFALHDGPLTLHMMMSKSFFAADLAFLSACQTASGNEKLPEESVHLAAGMLTAGYRTVFATMWSIKDEDAPMITKGVYSQLLNSKDEDKIHDRFCRACALHDAVRVLREKVEEKNFIRWVPFIHYGL